MNASILFISSPAPFDPMQCEAVCITTAILCKEMLHLEQNTGISIHELEEVKVLMQVLAHLEHAWGKSSASANGSAT
jgi:hypothetical protein